MTASWVLPRTWTTGEMVTASLLNEQVRDNLEYLYARTAGLVTVKGSIRMQVADSLGGSDGHRLVFGGQTYESWHLCNGDADIDGSGVTAPDMRDRFVVGAGNTYAQGATGGAATINVAHTHTGGYAADATALTNHVHPVSAATGNDSGLAPYKRYSSASGTAIAATPHYHNVGGSTDNPNSNPPHVHDDLSTGATASGGSAALATLPPYRAAYWFICITD